MTTVNVVRQTGEVEREGSELFRCFLKEEIEKEGLQTPDVNIDGSGDQLLWDSVHFSSPNLRKVGQELRIIADEFSKSQERMAVNARANEVNLSSITEEHFFSLLEELFKGGLSRTRIVVLFFFCSDIAIRALQGKFMQYFQNLVKWTLTFITERICNWVRQNGGWGKVLSHSFNCAFKSAVIVIGFAVAISVVVFIRRKLC